MPPHHLIFPRPNFEIELIASFIIIICSIFIYLRTKEIYDLTNYKGLKYFSNVFLFFAISHFFKFLFHQLKFFFRHDMIPDYFGLIILTIIIYTSSMVVIYLFYSVSWKKIDKKPFNQDYFHHFIPLLIVFISIIFNFKGFFLFFQTAIFLYAAIVSFIQSRTKKKSHLKSFYIIYILIFLFWVVDIAGIFLPKMFIVFKSMLQLISAALFIFILYGVSKRLKKR